MGLALILIGIVLFFVPVPYFIPILCIVVGIILFFVPAMPYGYSSWHRRGPP